MKLLPRNDADFFNYGCTVGIDNALSAKTQIAAFPSPAADVLNVKRVDTNTKFIDQGKLDRIFGY